MRNFTIYSGFEHFKRGLDTNWPGGNRIGKESTAGKSSRNHIESD